MDILIKYLGEKSIKEVTEVVEYKKLKNKVNYDL